MPADGRGRTAGWAKVLAAVVLLVLLPLVIWALFSFQGSGAFPW
ncbi:hypothetical protein [Streptomyces cellostaticus]|nr:hypothetical protein [Streptomyces cellostaticus]